MSDTIAAIATGNRRAAIGILRLSGDGAVSIASSVFRPFRGKPLSERRDRELIYGELLAADGRVLDLCLATVSRAPHSYTGENTAEFQCHGSPTVLAAGLRSLFSAGARQAKAGEFTRRAFLNGQLDLTQAEAVIDLIDAETEESAKNAASQLGGAVSARAERVYSSLADLSAHFHAILDYPDEELPPFERAELGKTLAASAGELQRLIDGFGRGRILRDGVPAAIVGRPNAGKSSLLNALLGFDRAIVTDIPGTTRDTIEEKVLLGGVLLRLSDTAGLRESSDSVEKIGVERAIAAARGAELCLAVFDGSKELSSEDMEAVAASRLAPRRIAVINKCDLTQNMDGAVIEREFESVCRVSALDGEGLERLGAAVAELFPEASPSEEAVISSPRQAEAVERAAEALRSAAEALDAGATPDIILTESERAMEALGELLGKVVRDDVTERIFSRFCVGK